MDAEYYCIDCKAMKPYGYFYPSHLKRCKRARCKPHANAFCAKYARTPEANKKKMEYQKAYHERHPELRRKVNLKYKYGLTPEQYTAMVIAQGGHCAICGGPPNAKGLAVDHDHSTGSRLRGRPRGLLCIRCNTGLGGFKDSPELMLRAIAYVERHRNPTTPIQIPDGVSS